MLNNEGKLYDGGKILLGIVIFLGFVTFPFWNRALSTVEVKEPKPRLETPVIEKLAKKECVKPKEFMRREHMVLLNQWRDTALRDGDRILTHVPGEISNVRSLQRTCMKCHSNKKTFCDECHAYAGVNPYCWDCHYVPEEKKI